MSPVRCSSNGGPSRMYSKTRGILTSHLAFGKRSRPAVRSGIRVQARWLSRWHPRPPQKPRHAKGAARSRALIGGAAATTDLSLYSVPGKNLLLSRKRECGFEFREPLRVHE